MEQWSAHLNKSDSENWHLHKKNLAPSSSSHLRLSIIIVALPFIKIDQMKRKYHNFPHSTLIQNLSIFFLIHFMIPPCRLILKLSLHIKIVYWTSFIDFIFFIKFYFFFLFWNRNFNWWDLYGLNSLLVCDWCFLWENE